jgi:hypothetical protein
MFDAAIVTAVTKASSRKSLFHFTRVSNLSAMADFDTLFSSNQFTPEASGARRLKATKVQVNERFITINAHLRIPDRMFDAGITQEQFRTYLDRHVFFWPTLKDCQKMLDTYKRREPSEKFAVLELDAYTLLAEHFECAKLTKYDSGSAPRFPNKCTYKKSLDIFLPLKSFMSVLNPIVPIKPSEIREVLIEDRVTQLSAYLQVIWIDHSEDLPERWRGQMRSLVDLKR